MCKCTSPWLCKAEPAHCAGSRADAFGNLLNLLLPQQGTEGCVKRGCEVLHSLVPPGCVEAALCSVRANLWDTPSRCRQQKASPRLSAATVLKSRGLKRGRKTSFYSLRYNSLAGRIEQSSLSEQISKAKRHGSVMIWRGGHMGSPIEDHGPAQPHNGDKFYPRRGCESSGHGCMHGWALMSLADSRWLPFAMPRGRGGCRCVTTCCSCSWGPDGACVLVPPSSGCPQAYNVSPPLPLVPFSSAGNLLTMLGCSLAWGRALLHMGFVAHSPMIN